MNEISKKTKLMALTTLCLWLIGSTLLFQESNGKVIIIITAAVIIVRLKFQITKDRKTNPQ